MFYLAGDVWQCIQSDLSQCWLVYDGW